LSCSGCTQWLEEQLRCERAFNEDLKARLNDLEAQKEASISSGGKLYDCDIKQIDENSQQRVVRQRLLPPPCYLRQGGVWSAPRRSVIRSVSSVIMSFRGQDYCKSYQPISLKLSVIIRPTNRKNWLTFGDDQIPDTDSGSLFHSRHRYGIGVYRQFITIFHSHSPANFHFTRQMTDAAKMNP